MAKNEEGLVTREELAKRIKDGTVQKVEIPIMLLHETIQEERARIRKETAEEIFKEIEEGLEKEKGVIWSPYWQQLKQKWTQEEV